MAVFAKASLFQKSQPESSAGEPLSAVAAAATVGVTIYPAPTNATTPFYICGNRFL
jgi:hypothetical protein